MSENSDKPEAAGAADNPQSAVRNPQSDEQLLVTASPHIRTRDDIPRVMWTVVVALLPALFAGCYFGGLTAIKIILIAVAGAVAAEAVIQKLARKAVTVSDGSAVVTGLLVAFVIPSNVPWFVPLVGSVFAISIVKQAFGGLGCNIWNPALAGRAFLVACFAGLMTGGWQGIPAQPDAKPPLKARSANWVEITKGQRVAAAEYSRIDAMTGASALSARKDYLRDLNSTTADVPKRKESVATPEGNYNLGKLSKSEKEQLGKRLGRSPRETLRKTQQLNDTSLLDMLLGAQVGCVGETSAAALIIGGIILLATGTIRWYIPVSFIGAVALFGWLLPVGAWAYDAETEVLRHGWVWCGGQPLFQILAGGVMLGAIFMATDMVTSPLSRTGKLIFGFGCGLLTVIIRKYGGYPEGVCYAILLMNTAVPLIDAFTKPRVYGKTKQ